METRKAAVAGQFYPDDSAQCLVEIEQLLIDSSLPDNLPTVIDSGIVPHAGWSFSGALAASVFRAIKQQNKTVDTFILFAAGHYYSGTHPVITSSDIWSTPLGDMQVDVALRDIVAKETSAFCDIAAHKYEHSIEVQLPFIQHLFGDVLILPVVVGPHSSALAFGEQVAEIGSSLDKKIVCIGSTDLTHYGEQYDFTPAGAEASGRDWAEQVNDKLFIDDALKMDPSALLGDSLEKSNSCGPGAAAAALSYAIARGKTSGCLIGYTNSYRVMMQNMMTQSESSVGYAGLVF